MRVLDKFQMDHCDKFYSSKQTELIRRAHSQNASHSFAQLLIRTKNFKVIKGHILNIKCQVTEIRKLSN